MTIPEMAQEIGLNMGDFNFKAPVPATAKEIAEAYQINKDHLCDAETPNQRGDSGFPLPFSSGYRIAPSCHA